MERRENITWTMTPSQLFCVNPIPLCACTLVCLRDRLQRIFFSSQNFSKVDLFGAAKVIWYSSCIKIFSIFSDALLSLALIIMTDGLIYRNSRSAISQALPPSVLTPYRGMKDQTSVTPAYEFGTFRKTPYIANSITVTTLTLQQKPLRTTWKK